VARELTMPRLSDSMEEGTILSWLVAEGDVVQAGQPLVEVETDKAVVTYEADAAGTVLSLAVTEGSSVPVGAPIAVLGEAGESLPQAGSPEALAAVGGSAPPAFPEALAAVDAAAPPGSGQAPAAGRGSPRVKASPLARRMAGELNVDLAAVTGSGPQGRVIRADVERAASDNGDPGADVERAASDNGDPGADVERAASDNGDPGAVGVPAEPGAAKGQASRQDLTRLQRTVARRMAESRATVPDIELRAEVDMTEAVVLREQLRDVSGEILPSLGDLIIKATALALVEFPRLNGAYRDSQFETYSRVNIGTAVAGDEVLAVPTVFDADTKSLGTIARTTRALAARVRDGSIAPSELAGGTFTVSNLGMYGIDSFSAVINPPQAAILAVGAMRRRPVVADSGEIVARQTIQLALACDHRIVYGVDGARFLARLRELLEHPLSLLL
jgi:pyruvate dehydrogenase E2 component (dihydrolipoamide acetyltransferase)